MRALGVTPSVLNQIVKVYPRICRNGHTVAGPKDEDDGCRFCAIARKARYNVSPKGHAAVSRYRQTPKGQAYRARERASDAAHERHLRFRATNPDKLRRWKTEWRAAHPDKERAQQQRAYAKSKGLSQARRRALMAGVPSEPYTRLEIYERDGGCCYLCSKPVAFTVFEVDHVIPISAGGSNTRANVATSCRRCNRRKGARVLADPCEL
jgi:5-methylcytosine-specific restriction endonuclease McrA